MMTSGLFLGFSSVAGTSGKCDPLSMVSVVMYFLLSSGSTARKTGSGLVLAEFSTLFVLGPAKSPPWVRVFMCGYSVLCSRSSWLGFPFPG